MKLPDPAGFRRDIGRIHPVGLTGQARGSGRARRMARVGRGLIRHRADLDDRRRQDYEVEFAAIEDALAPRQTGGGEVGQTKLSRNGGDMAIAEHIGVIGGNGLAWRRANSCGGFDRTR